MENKILFLGVGNAGSMVVDELNKINPLIPHIKAINTNPTELSRVSIDKINIGELSGSGGDRNLCLKNIQNEKDFNELLKPVSDTINNFKIRIIIIIGSTGGGTGSALLEYLPSYFQEEHEEIAILLIGITPLMEEKSCWENTSQLLSGLKESGYFKNNAMWLARNSKDKKDTFVKINKKFSHAINNIITSKKQAISNDLDIEDLRILIKKSGLLDIEASNSQDETDFSWAEQETATNITAINCNALEMLNSRIKNFTSTERHIYNYIETDESKQYYTIIYSNVDSNKEFIEALKIKSTKKETEAFGFLEKTEEETEKEPTTKIKSKFNFKGHGNGS